MKRFHKKVKKSRKRSMKYDFLKLLKGYIYLGAEKQMNTDLDVLNHNMEKLCTTLFALSSDKSVN